MSTPSEKVHKVLSKELGDFRMNEVSLVNLLEAEPYDIHARLMNIILSYIYTQAYNYEVGLIPLERYDIIRMCKKIKDYALNEDLDPIKNPKYEEAGNEWIAI
jgi:hypothetical protein